MVTIPWSKIPFFVVHGLTPFYNRIFLANFFRKKTRTLKLKK